MNDAYDAAVRQYARNYAAAYVACANEMGDANLLISRDCCDRAATWFAGRIAAATYDNDALAAMSITEDADDN